MGSRSNSTQQTNYETNTSYEYNMLDGGAIEGAFDFAAGVSKDAFTFGGEAFDSIDNAVNGAMEYSNAQLNTMSNLVKSTQTQGATELINANKETTETMFKAVAGLMVFIVLMVLVMGMRK